MKKLFSYQNPNLPISAAIIFLVAVGVMLPIRFFGAPQGTLDLTHHFQIANAFFESLRSGDAFYSGWVFQENFGYGAVTVRHYPPLMNYTLALARALAGDWETAEFAALSFWSFIGGVGMFLWAGEIFKNSRQALVAAVLFVCAPYHLNQFYNASFLGEFAALSTLPFCFYFAGRICRDGRAGDIFGFGAGCALLILSNLPQTVIGAIFLVPFVLANLDRRTMFGRLLKFAAAAAVTLVLSGFYLARLLPEMGWINVYRAADPEYFYGNFFLLNDFSFDERGTWFTSLVFVVVAGITAASVLFSKNAKNIWRDRDLKVVVLMGAASALLMLPVTDLLWSNLDFLQRLQFPWRFLSIFSCAAALLTAYCLGSLRKKDFAPERRPVTLILIGLVLILMTFSIKQIALGALFGDENYLNALVERSAAEKSLPHWMPFWAQTEMTAEREKVVAADRTVQIDLWERERREFTIAADENSRDAGETNARIALLYYPHWRATINGRPAALEKHADGATAIAVPPEKSAVTIYFEEPGTVRAANFLSLGGWLLLICFAFYKLFRSLFVRG